MKNVIVVAITLTLIQLTHWELYTNFPRLVHINYGAVWGIPVPNFASVIMTLVGLGILAYLGATVRPRWSTPLLLILTSGLSNLADRLRYGGVVDYIDTKIWPIFNVPDIIIVVAVAWYLLSMALKAQSFRRSALPKP